MTPTRRALPERRERTDYQERQHHETPIERGLHGKGLLFDYSMGRKSPVNRGRGGIWDFALDTPEGKI